MRVGGHFLEAQDYAEAFSSLMRAEAACRARGDDMGAERALDQAQHAAEQLEDIDSVSHRVELLQRRADILRIRGAWEAAETVAQELVQISEDAGALEALSTAFWVLGQCAFERGAHDDAVDAAVRAQAVAQEAEDSKQIIRAEMLLGNIAGVRSDWDQALSFFRSARHSIDRDFAEDDRLQAESQFCLATVHRQQGRLDDALPLLIDALRRWERCGDQRGMAYVANALADAARLQGRQGRAMDWYRRAKKVYESVGAWEAWLVRLNLALVLMDAKRFEEAHQEVAACIEFFGKTGQRTWFAVSQIFALPGLAVRRDWSLFDTHFEAGAADLRELGFADADLALVLETAGERAEADGERRRADQAFALAAEQWRALGRAEEANAASLRAGPS